MGVNWDDQTRKSSNIRKVLNQVNGSRVVLQSCTVHESSEDNLTTYNQITPFVPSIVVEISFDPFVSLSRA